MTDIDPDEIEDMSIEPFMSPGEHPDAIGLMIAIETHDNQFTGEITGVRTVDRGEIELTASNVEDRDGEVVGQEVETV